MRRAPASLNRLSPSRITRRRCGGRSWRSTAVAAAASGGATTAPRTTAAVHGMSGTRVRTSHGHGGHRDPHREEGQPRHGAPVISQVTDRGVERRVEEDRSHEQDQGQLGIQRDDGRAGHQRQARARQSQERGVGRPDAAGQGGQCRADQQEDDDGLEDLQGMAPGRLRSCRPPCAEPRQLPFRPPRITAWAVNQKDRCCASR